MALELALAVDHPRAVARPERRQTRRPAFGWGSLTPTEQRVVALIGHGLANATIAEQLVVSRRTVETHVSHLFRKLGVTSRVELALLAAREVGGLGRTA